MKIHTVFRVYSILFWLLIPGLVSANSFTVNERVLVSSNRVTRVLSDFTYEVKITNIGDNASSATATVTSTDTNTVIVDGSLTFGVIAGGSQGISNDTFTLRQNRRFPFNPDALVFEFSSIPDTGNVKPIANAGPDQTVKVNGLIMLNGINSSDADGDPLTFQWSMIGLPAGSSAVSRYPKVS